MKNLINLTLILGALSLFQACESKDEVKKSCSMNEQSVDCKTFENNKSENTSEFEIENSEIETSSLELSQSLNIMTKYKKGVFTLEQDLNIDDAVTEDNMTATLQAFVLRGTTLKILDDENQRVQLLEVSEFILNNKNHGKILLKQIDQSTFEYTYIQNEKNNKIKSSIQIELLNIPSSEDTFERQVAVKITVATEVQKKL